MVLYYVNTIYICIVIYVYEYDICEVSQMYRDYTLF